MAQGLATALFPSDCRLCGLPLTNFSRLPVCPDCVAAIVPSRLPGCAICGERVFSTHATQNGVTLCGECRFEAPEFTRAAAFSAYDGGLRELIQLLKYEHIRPAASPLGNMLAQVLLTLSAEFGEQPPIVASVPLHSSKLQQRGYNQSDLIARVAQRQFRTAKLELLQLEPKLLARIRPTVPQTGLTRSQRQQNVRGAFTVLRPDLTAGRDILLIDDVLTTGTTARECARVLRQAGAERVFVATVARVFAPESRIEPTDVLVSARTQAAHA